MLDRVSLIREPVDRQTDRQLGEWLLLWSGLGCGGVELLAVVREAALKSEAGRAGFHSSSELRQRRVMGGAGPGVQRLQVLEAALGPPSSALGSERCALVGEEVGAQAAVEEEQEEEVELTLRQTLKRPLAPSSTRLVSSATMSRQLPMLRGRCGRVFCGCRPSRREAGLFLMAARGAKRPSELGNKFDAWRWNAEPTSWLSSAPDARLLADAKSCCRVSGAESSRMFSSEQLLV